MSRPSTRALAAAVVAAVGVGCDAGPDEPSSSPSAEETQVEDGTDDAPERDLPRGVTEAQVLEAAAEHLREAGADPDEFELEYRGVRRDGLLVVRAVHVDDLTDADTLGGGGRSRELHLDAERLTVEAELRFQ